MSAGRGSSSSRTRASSNSTVQVTLSMILHFCNIGKDDRRPRLALPLQIGPQYTRSAFVHAAFRRFTTPRHPRLRGAIPCLHRHHGRRARDPAAAPVVVPGALPDREHADRRPLLALLFLPPRSEEHTSE